MAPSEANALSFSVVVPKEVTINTSSLSGGSNNWAWLVATTDVITLGDVGSPSDVWSDAVVFTSLSGAGGTAPTGMTTRYNNESISAGAGGLQPGAVAGESNSFTGTLYTGIAGATDFEMSAVQAFISFAGATAKPTRDYMLRRAMSCPPS